MSSDIYQRSLDYHRKPIPGKLEVVPTKPLDDQQDLVLAYSPGVAAASKLIADDPAEVATLTSRSNLIAVISNGTAVLGLGNIGPLAAKPVMEGKAVLFKKFAGIDVFDIEINENDPDKLTYSRVNFKHVAIEDASSYSNFTRGLSIFFTRKLNSRVLKLPAYSC